MTEIDRLRATGPSARLSTSEMPATSGTRCRRRAWTASSRRRLPGASTTTPWNLSSRAATPAAATSAIAPSVQSHSPKSGSAAMETHGLGCHRLAHAPERGGLLSGSPAVPLKGPDRSFFDARPARISSFEHRLGDRRGRKAAPVRRVLARLRSPTAPLCPRWSGWSTGA